MPGIPRAEQGPPACEHLLRPPTGVRAPVSVAVLRRRRRDEAGGPELAELAALADGSLSSARRAQVEARVATSAELADLLAEQERAVALVRSASTAVEAPAALRAHIDAQRPARRPARR